MFLLPLALLVAAHGEDDPDALELLTWEWSSPVESAFPSWQVGDGAPRLVVTRVERDEHAELVLHTLDSKAPRALAAGAGWVLNWADFPAVAGLADGTLAWSWLVADPANEHSYATRFQIAGAGREPGAARALEEHRGPGEHGFVSLARLGKGADERFLALWLDGRATSGHGGETGLYARTLGRAGEPGPELLVDGRTCSCCPTSLVRLADGTHLAAWRDRSAEEVRDIALARFDGKSWSAPEPLHADGWKIDGCPVNGPRLAAGPAATAATWYTGAEGGKALVSLGDARGRAFGPPIRVDEGAAVGRGDVLVLPDGSAVVGWMEHGRTDSRWCLRKVRPGAEPGPVLVVAETSSARSSGFLRLAADGAEVLAAWTETAPERRVVVRRIRPLP
jgi:hypothetical protein